MGRVPRLEPRSRTSNDIGQGATQAKFEKRGTRIAVGLVTAGVVLPLVAGVLGSAEVFPYEHTITVPLIAMLIPIGSALRDIAKRLGGLLWAPGDEPPDDGTSGVPVPA